MANKFVVLFGTCDQWWAPGTSLEREALQRLLADPGLLVAWARSAGCPARAMELRVRVVEVEEDQRPHQGQVRKHFFDRPHVRVVPPEELAVTGAHLHRHTVELELIARV